jgi:hypothetical protein
MGKSMGDVFAATRAFVALSQGRYLSLGLE